MRTTIKPKYVSKKTSKAGKTYFEVEDSNGEKYTFHDTEIEEAISNHFGSFIEVEVVESNGWKNIRKFYCVAASQAQKPEKVQSESKPTIQTADLTDGYKAKTASMLTAYAKDMLVAKMEADKEYGVTKEKAEDAAAVVCIIYQEILKNL